MVVPPTAEELNTYSYENLLKRDQYIHELAEQRVHNRQQYEEQLTQFLASKITSAPTTPSSN